MKIESETPTPYLNNDDDIIAQALAILDRRMNISRDLLSSPTTVSKFLILKASGIQHEVFSVLFLDVRNRLIEAKDMFRGTLTQASVYPREVVIEALARGAASVILTHNHPSGNCEPSEADIRLTRALKDALALVDVKVLDHVIVAGNTHYCFAEHGKI